MSPAIEHFFKEEKPRSTNLQRAQDVMGSNITSRFEVTTVQGVHTGLEIANLDNSGPKNIVTGTIAGPFNVNGLTLVIASDTVDKVTVTFTGSGQTSAQVAAQINAQASSVVAAADNGSNKVQLSALTSFGRIQVFPASTALVILGLSFSAPPIDLAVDLYKVTQGLGADLNGELIPVSGDLPFVPSNPLRVDTQVPPVATPQSTGNIDIPFAQGVGNIDIDTFVCIRYLRTTDLAVLPSVVPGFHFEYPKQDDGYEIILSGTPADTTTVIAGGAQFLGFIRRVDGLISSIYPVGSTTPQFRRGVFSVDIRAHASDVNAHHNKAHQHTSSDGSAILDSTGDVLLGQTATPFATALSAAVGPIGATHWLGTFTSDPSLTASDGTAITPGIWYNSTVNQFKSWDGASTTTVSTGILLPDRVKISGQDIEDNLSYSLSNGVVTDAGLISDIFALLPNNTSTGPLGPIGSPGGAGLPDAVFLRQLRVGERVGVNGKEVTALIGSTLGLDGVYPTLPLYVLFFKATDNGNFWIAMLDNGSLSMVPVTSILPRDKFVVGQVALINGKVTGGTSGFTDLRVYGSVATANIQDQAVTTPKIADAAVTVVKLDPTSTMQFLCPTGSILSYAASAAPAGWLECDGSSYLTATYPGLAAAIGYSWGGSGANFNVPDLRGVALRGWNHGLTSPSVQTQSFPATTGKKIFILTGGKTYIPGRGNLTVKVNTVLQTLNQYVETDNITITFNTAPGNGKTVLLTITPIDFNDPDCAARTSRDGATVLGDNVGSYQLDANQKHSHYIPPNQFTMASGGAGGNIGGSQGAMYPADGNTDYAGGLEARMKNAYVMYMIKT